MQEQGKDEWAEKSSTCRVDERTSDLVLAGPGREKKSEEPVQGLDRRSHDPLAVHRPREELDAAVHLAKVDQSGPDPVVSIAVCRVDR